MLALIPNTYRSLDRYSLVLKQLALVMHSRKMGIASFLGSIQLVHTNSEMRLMAFSDKRLLHFKWFIGVSWPPPFVIFCQALSNSSATQQGKSA